MLTFDQVKDIVNGKLDPRIEAARKMKDKLRLHVDGIGLQSFLAKINNYENEGQFTARKKHAISNKFLSEELLRPVDNAFHARGGSRNYNFNAKQDENEIELIKLLLNVKNSQSLSEYMENEWFHWFVVDPNGLIFMEIQQDQTTEVIDNELITDTNDVLRPTYKSISEIRAYKQNGNTVDWVIFEPHVTINGKETKEKKELFWVVDELFYYLYKKDREGVSLVGKPIENSFGRVPAILTSNINDSVTGWKKSPIDSQVELLDKYLVSNSVLTISEFFHNYLQQWTYIDKCSMCNGTGKDIKNQTSDCPRCEGTGQSDRKDVTDIIKLKIPDSDQVKIDPPAGFIFAPTDAWDGQINSVERSSNMIFFSQWGTTISKRTSSTKATDVKTSANETATGRILDAQPMNLRLNKYSISIETAQTSLANFIGEFNFPETFEDAIIQKGRRYLIETPDQIWEKYLKAKKDNAPVSTLDLFLTQFFESEFRENEQLFIFESKKAKLEPFVHWDVLTVKDLNVSEIDYKKKLYFSDWIHTKEVRQIIETPIEDLNKELTTFAESKNTRHLDNENTGHLNNKNNE